MRYVVRSKHLPVSLSCWQEWCWSIKKVFQKSWIEKKRLQTLHRSALPPDTSLEQLWATSASAGGQEDQVLPIDTLVSNYYAAILWVVTPSVSSYVCFCTLSSTHLDWISQSLRQNTLKQENPVLPLSSRLSPAASLYISWRTSSRATPCVQTNCRTVCYYFARESCQIFFKDENISRWTQSSGTYPYYYWGKTPCYMTCCLKHL